MKRTFGLAAGASFLFAVGCGADATDASPTGTPFDQLGQEVEADKPVSFLTGPTTGKLDDVAFTATLSVNKFVAEEGTVYAVGTLSEVTGLPEAAAAKLEAADVTLPLSVQPEGGFPTDGSAPLCETLGLFIAESKVDAKAGALTIDRTDLDITTTPGGGAVVAQLVCGIPDLLESGGALADITGDLSTLIVILNGLTGLPQDEVEAGPSVVDIDSRPSQDGGATGPSIEVSPREQL